MERNKKITGYPSIDKPQYKFYRDTPIRYINTKQTIYEMIFNTNKNNMNESAIMYMNKEWSFQKLKETTDKLADAFIKLGLEIGDVVLVGMINSIESVVILLALNKIGVVSKWFDVRAGEKDIEDYIHESNCKYIIAIDILISKIEKILNHTNVEKVIIVTPTESLSILTKILYKAKLMFNGNYYKIPKDKRYISYNDFISQGDYNSEVECVKFDKNRPSIMIQSSGTTGKPKSILHSDFSVTSCVNEIAYSDIPLGRGKELLVLLPPWIAYGLGNAILLPMALGTKIILSPEFGPDSIINNLGNFTIAFAAPFNYRYIKNNYDKLNKGQRDGIKRIECLVSGGDKISAEENKEMEEILDVAVINGYGNNEGLGCLTVNPIHNNKYGTVGIPKYGETIIAYDNDEEKELPYGVSGEICCLANTMFLCYEGNLEKTNTVKKLHSDGKVWLHTGDIGYIDEDGYLTLNGRSRRVIVRRAFKISAYTIEDKICEHPLVKECVAVEVDDKKEEHVPMAFVVLEATINDNLNNIERSIYEKCRKELKEYEIPKYFRFVEELPYTDNGKYNFRLLEKIGNNFIKN